MKFHVIYQKTAPNAHSPIQVEQTTGRGVGWVNRYLNREYVRRLASTSLRIYAYNLLHFVRWWESLHHTGDIAEADLTPSTLLDYLRFQSSLQPRPSASTINDRVADADRAIRNEFPDQVCYSLNLSASIVPHQLRHTYATEMLRAGVSFPVLMKLLGHTNPEMTMRYVDVALTDLQREFHQARAHPKHLVPQPKAASPQLRAGLDGVIDSLLAAQHVMEMFRRPLPKGSSRSCLDRLSNRLTKILSQVRKLSTP